MPEQSYDDIKNKYTREMSSGFKQDWYTATSDYSQIGTKETWDVGSGVRRGERLSVEYIREKITKGSRAFFNKISNNLSYKTSAKVLLKDTAKIGMRVTGVQNTRLLLSADSPGSTAYAEHILKLFNDTDIGTKVIGLYQPNITPNSDNLPVIKLKYLNLELRTDTTATDINVLLFTLNIESTEVDSNRVITMYKKGLGLDPDTDSFNGYVYIARLISDSESTANIDSIIEQTTADTLPDYYGNRAISFYDNYLDGTTQVLGNWLMHPSEIACCFIRNLAEFKPDHALLTQYAEASETVEDLANTESEHIPGTPVEWLKTIRSILVFTLAMCKINKGDRQEAFLFSLSKLLEDTIETALTTAISTYVNLIATRLEEIIRQHLVDDVLEGKSEYTKANILECTPYLTMIDYLVDLLYSESGVLSGALNFIIKSGIKIEREEYQRTINSDRDCLMIKTMIGVIDILLWAARPDNLCGVNYRNHLPKDNIDENVNVDPLEQIDIDTIGISKDISLNLEQSTTTLSIDYLPTGEKFSLNINSLLSEPADSDLKSFLILTGLTPAEADKQLQPEVQRASCSDEHIKQILTSSGCTSCGRL